jgi:hypothetical protein
MIVSVEILKRESSTSFVHKIQQFNTFTFILVHPFHIFSQIPNVTGHFMQDLMITFPHIKTCIQIFLPAQQLYSKEKYIK